MSEELIFPLIIRNIDWGVFHKDQKAMRGLVMPQTRKKHIFYQPIGHSPGGGRHSYTKEACMSGRGKLSISEYAFSQHWFHQWYISVKKWIKGMLFAKIGPTKGMFFAKYSSTKGDFFLAAGLASVYIFNGSAPQPRTPHLPKPYSPNLPLHNNPSSLKNVMHHIFISKWQNLHCYKDNTISSTFAHLSLIYSFTLKATMFPFSSPRPIQCSVAPGVAHSLDVHVFARAWVTVVIFGVCHLGNTWVSNLISNRKLVLK